MIDWQYFLLKWQLIALLIFNRRTAAVSLLDSMLKMYPNDAYALFSRAHLHSQLNNNLLSLEDYRALTYGNNSANAAHWFNQGFLQEQMGFLEQAELSFNRALQLDNSLDRCWYGLGLVLIQLKRFEEAIVALRRNTELQPMSPYGWYQLARIHTDRSETEEATRIIRHLKGFEPKIATQLEFETGIKV
jgi:tetratricopeptide (TPR) repeat protein